MFFNVLVANENVKQNSHCCNYLTNDKDFKISSTKTGLSTLNTYLKLRPNILILDTAFNDLNYVAILNHLNNLDDERFKCNIILTINSSNDLLLLNSTQKIHNIFPKPIDYQQFSKTIQIMKKELMYKEISSDEINFLLLKLNFNIGSNGCDYLRTAIFYCYYNPNALKSLDGIYDFISKQYNTDVKTVKSAIRSALVPLNNSYQLNAKNNLFNIFDKSRKIITPKYFLEAFVTFLHYKKAQNK